MIAIAGADNGTRWSLPAFMRPAGTVHTPLGDIDLVPSGAEHLAGSCRRQDRKLKRAGSNACVLPQRGHKGADFGIGQGCMMLDTLHLGGPRQQVIQ